MKPVPKNAYPGHPAHKATTPIVDYVVHNLFEDYMDLG